MHLMHQKWHPGLSIQTPPPPVSRASESDESNGSKCISSLGLGANFRFISCIRCGPRADSDESTEPQVLALGPTLDSLNSLGAFDALDAEALEGRGGGPGSNVLGALSIH